MTAQYIEVLDPNNGEPVRVNLSNGALLISSIDGLFRGTFGLKYKDVTTGAKYGVSTDPINQVFLAPKDGWGNKTYELVYSPNRSASVTPDRPTSPWMHVQRELPTINSVSKFCFYLKKEVNSNKENKTGKEVKIEVKSCVTRISKRYFATYHHKSHKDFKEGKEVEIFPNEGEEPFKATCKFVNEKWDFILFKSNEDVEGDGPNISQSFYPGERIILYGRAGKNGTLAPQEGIINSTLQYWDKDKMYASFLLGTIKTDHGDSGGGVFDFGGLIGMSVGNTHFSDPQYSVAATSAAHFNSKNYIIMAKDLLAVVDTLEGTKNDQFIQKPLPGMPPIARNDEPPHKKKKGNETDDDF